MIRIKTSVIGGAKKLGGKALTALIPVGLASEGYNIGRDKHDEYGSKANKAKEIAKSAAIQGGFGAAFGTSLLGKDYAKAQDKKGNLEFTKADKESINNLTKTAKTKTLTNAQKTTLGRLHAKKAKWGGIKNAARVKGGIQGAALGGAIALGSAVAGNFMRNKNNVTAGLLTKAHKEATFTLRPKPGTKIDNYDIEDTIQKLGPDVRHIQGIRYNPDDTVTVTLLLAKDTDLGLLVRKISNIMTGTLVALATTAAVYGFANRYKAFNTAKKSILGGLK